ncbi:MAG: L-seryl-tRNA(Sec) selenium transferase, partial [Desulfatiglandales bacterium]
MESGELFRLIPKVDRLLNTPEVLEAMGHLPKRLAMAQITAVLEEIRQGIRAGEIVDPSELELPLVVERVLKGLKEVTKPSLRKVVNATGVVVHTNLGRSPLPRKVMEDLIEIASGYSNLEYNLREGRRGNRFTHVEDILKELTGAEAATVVNNNAAAVLLSLDTVAKGKEVIVSRGELIEIGGSFRIPEVMKRSGARLVEVGTTNKTKLQDYESAITPETALLLKVHTSNYKIIGFTQSVSNKDLVSLGKRYSIPVMEDLGSGCFIDLSQYGYEKEPTVQEVVSQGVDIITFSGDKLLGGPQAGIILGKRDLVERIRKNQLARAVRIDKLTLCTLESTLRLYLD